MIGLVRRGLKRAASQYRWKRCRRQHDVMMDARRSVVFDMMAARARRGSIKIIYRLK